MKVWHEMREHKTQHRRQCERINAKPGLYQDLLVIRTTQFLWSQLHQSQQSYTHYCYCAIIITWISAMALKSTANPTSIIVNTNISIKDHFPRYSSHHSIRPLRLVLIHDNIRNDQLLDCMYQCAPKWYDTLGHMAYTTKPACSIVLHMATPQKGQQWGTPVRTNDWPTSVGRCWPNYISTTIEKYCKNI